MKTDSIINSAKYQDISAQNSIANSTGDQTWPQVGDEDDEPSYIQMNMGIVMQTQNQFCSDQLSLWI